MLGGDGRGEHAELTGWCMRGVLEDQRSGAPILVGRKADGQPREVRLEQRARPLGDEPRGLGVRGVQAVERERQRAGVEVAASSVSPRVLGRRVELDGEHALERPQRLELRPVDLRLATKPDGPCTASGVAVGSASSVASRARIRSTTATCPGSGRAA